jgi:DNA-directed RNA polymerase I subunit RPA49
MFQGLGCKVEILTPEQREKKGISIAEARNNKRAILKAPVVFPRPKTGPVRR